MLVEIPFIQRKTQYWEFNTMKSFTSLFTTRTEHVWTFGFIFCSCTYTHLMDVVCTVSTQCLVVLELSPGLHHPPIYVNKRRNCKWREIQNFNLELVSKEREINDNQDLCEIWLAFCSTCLHVRIPKIYCPRFLHVRISNINCSRQTYFYFLIFLMCKV